MMREKRLPVLITVLICCLLPVMPFHGYAADLTISDITTATGDFSVSGIIHATFLGGDGSGLTNVTASGLSCTGCVTPLQLNFTPGTVTYVETGTGLAGGPITTTGTLSVNFGGNGSASTVARSDHNHDGTYQKKYAKTVVVSPFGTNAQNGAALLSALAGITDNNASNPYLVKIEPGTYDVGSTYVLTKAYVDIEGSGENTTIIAGSLVSNLYGVVNCSANAEVRFLSVRNLMGGTQDCGNMMALSVFNPSCKITNVTATALDTFTPPKCWTYGVGVLGSTSPVITNVTASGSGGTRNHGVYMVLGSPVMTNVTAAASGGAGALCNGILISGNATPVMRNVTASASGCTESWGIYNLTSSPVMQGLVVSVKNGGTHSRGIYNSGLGSPLIRDAFIQVDGGGGVFADGVFSDDGATPELVNVSIKAGNATNNFGISNNAATVNVDHSVINADTSVYNDNGATVRIGNSRLDGGFVKYSGTIKCFNVYDGNYDPVTCP